MARMRMVKPGFFTNDTLAELDPFARLLFIGLWPRSISAGINAALAVPPPAAAAAR